MTALSKFWREARKTVVALVGTGIGFASFVIASESGPITASEWLMGATGLAIALGVYVAPNDPA